MYLEANLVNDGHFIFSHFLVWLCSQLFLLCLTHLKKLLTLCYKEPFQFDYIGLQCFLDAIASPSSYPCQ